MKRIVLSLLLALTLAGTANAWHPFAVYGTGRGTASGKLYEPTDVEVDASGYVYVVERYNSRVQKFSNSSNASVRTYGRAGNNASDELDSPQAIALREGGNLTQILIADTQNHRVRSLVIFTNGSQETVNWSGFGERCYSDCAHNSIYFEAPQGIAAGPDRIVVGDNGNARVQSFESDDYWNMPTTADRTLIDGLNTPGGAFGSVCGVAYANARIYAADSEKSNVRVLLLNGSERLRFGQNGTGTYDFWAPKGIDADADGNIYVADTNNGRIVIYDHAGVYYATIGSLNCSVSIMNSPNTLSLSQFCRPEGVKVRNGKLYVADTGNHRVLAYDLPDNMPTERCDEEGNYDPCSEVTLAEVVDRINRWAAGEATLSQVIELINLWAAA
jgi:tripartite motif-containing protein 71